MTTTSPLETASPKSLEELFNTDPALFTGPDDPRVVEIVEALRRDRARWIEKEKAAPKEKAKKEKVAATLDLNLDDLGL
jgi:hypothetical protein